MYYVITYDKNKSRNFGAYCLERRNMFNIKYKAKTTGNVIMIPVVLALCFISKAETTFVIIIAFCSPSYLGQETAKRPFGPRVKLPPAHMSITRTHTVEVSHCLFNC